MATTPDAGPEYTPDGHHIVVNGRKWRATDPGIPEKLRAELVAELSAARRAIKTDGDAARPRVQDAKVALGERGRAWWESQTDEALQDRMQATIRTLLRHRDGKTICPSDVARVVGGDSWRALMDDARRAAYTLRDAGEVVITQRGQPVGDDAKGPVRIAPPAVDTREISASAAKGDG